MGIGPGEPSFVVAPCSILLGRKKKIKNGKMIMLKKEQNIEKRPVNSMGQRGPVTQSTTPLNASRFAPRRKK